VKRDIVWGYLAQFLQYGAALLVLPLLLRKLTGVELGIWYVLLTISTLVMMLDMGFTPTLARNVSYILGGARVIFRAGHAVGESGGQVDYGLLKGVIIASKRIFLWLSIAAFVLMASAGTWFILSLSQGKIPLWEIICAWILFVVSACLNLYFKYYTPLLQGRGLFAEYYRATALSNISFVVTAAVLLMAGLGLIGVSIGFCVSAIVGRWLSGRYFNDLFFLQKLALAPAVAIPIVTIIMTLWNNAWRLGVVVVGAFLTLKANTFVASANLGLEVTAAYALTIQVFSTVSSIAIVTVTIQQQKMAQLRVVGERGDLQAMIELGLGSAVLLYIAGATLIVIFGNALIAQVGGNTAMLDRSMLIAVAFMLLLELNHSVSASIITTGNVVPFVKPSIISGVAVMVASVIGLYIFQFGVWWLIASQALVQIAYNNWRWPTVLAQEFHTSYLNLVAGGIRQIGAKVFFFMRTRNA
jgi:hypothetical protein